MCVLDKNKAWFVSNKANVCLYIQKKDTVVKTGKECQCVSHVHYEDSLCESDNKERKCFGVMKATLC